MKNVCEPSAFGYGKRNEPMQRLIVARSATVVRMGGLKSENARAVDGGRGNLKTKCGCSGVRRDATTDRQLVEYARYRNV